MAMLLFWVVTPCGLVRSYQRFGETFLHSFHLHSSENTLRVLMCSFISLTKTALKTMRTKPRSKWLNKIQCSSYVPNLVQIGLVVWSCSMLTKERRITSGNTYAILEITSWSAPIIQHRTGRVKSLRWVTRWTWHLYCAWSREELPALHSYLEVTP
jgi:hypothetical protein